MMFPLIFFSLLSFSSHYYPQKTIKLDYQPNGKIIQIVLDENLIHTDRNSVFHILDAYEDLEYAAQIKRLISDTFRNDKSDTIKFEGSFIPFDKEAARARKWFVDFTVLDLIKANRVSLIDKSGQPVKVIKTRIKSFGKKEKGRYMKARFYYNQQNGIEIMSEVLRIRPGTPKF